MIDLKDMQGFNPEVKNGIDSVSKEKVYLKNNYPYCITHGAMLKVSKDGIWRCGELGCDNGCYYG